MIDTARKIKLQPITLSMTGYTLSRLNPVIEETMADLLIQYRTRKIMVDGKQARAFARPFGVWYIKCQ